MSLRYPANFRIRLGKLMEKPCQLGVVAEPGASGSTMSEYHGNIYSNCLWSLGNLLNLLLPRYHWYFSLLSVIGFLCRYYFLQPWEIYLFICEIISWVSLDRYLWNMHAFRVPLSQPLKDNFRRSVKLIPGRNNQKYSQDRKYHLQCKKLKRWIQKCKGKE